MNGRQFRQVKNIVEAVSGDLLNKRIRVVGATGLGTTITAAATTSQKLLQVDTDGNPNEDLATDGTNVAECNYGSRLLSIDLTLIIKPASTSMIEWMLYRDPDGALTGTADLAELFAADVGLTNTMIRKCALAFGQIAPSLTNDFVRVPVQISRAAMARNKKLAANDAIYLVFKNLHGTNTGTYWLWGKIVVSEN